MDTDGKTLCVSLCALWFKPVSIRAIREFRSLGCWLAVHGCSFARYSAPVSATRGLALS